MSVTTNSSAFKATNLLDVIETTFRKNMPLKKHRSYLQTYENSFTGKEAVNFMLEMLPTVVSKHKNILTRSNCEQLLNFMMSRDIFYNVRKKNDVEFKDNLNIFKFKPQNNLLCRSVSTTERKETVSTIKSTSSLPETINKSNMKLIKFFGLPEDFICENVFVNNIKEDNKLKSFDASDKLMIKENCKNKFEEVSSENLTSWKYCILTFISQYMNQNTISTIFSINEEKVAWNCEKIGSKGIVKCMKEKEEISSHLLKMMRYLAKYPFNTHQLVEYSKQYLGFEIDIFRNILCELSRQGTLLSVSFSDLLVEIISLECKDQNDKENSPVVRKLGGNNLNRFFNRNVNKSVNFGHFKRSNERCSFHHYESLTPDLNRTNMKDSINSTPISSRTRKITLRNYNVTSEIKHRLLSYVLLLLEPHVRRKLHIIIRFMIRVKNNENIKLSQKNNNKIAILKTMTPLLIKCSNMSKFHLQSNVVEYLMDNESELFKISDKLVYDRKLFLLNLNS